MPGRPDAVACNVAGTAELVVEPREPLTLRRARGGPLVARRRHLAADDSAATHRALGATPA